LADEEIRIWESLIMVFTYLLYCLYMKFNPNIINFLGVVNPSDIVDEVHASEDGSNTENSQGEHQISTSEGSTKASICSGGPNASNIGQCSSDPLHKPTKKEWSYRQSLALQQSSSLQCVVPIEGTPEEDETTQPPPDGVRQSLEAVQQASEEQARRERRWCRDPFLVLWEWTMPTPQRGRGFPLFCASIAWIGICTYLMVDSTNRIGIILTAPPFVMGLIFLAAGTSIPDTLGSIAVARQGEGDMAVANALGSNVFDILTGLGVPWTISNMIGKEVVFRGKFDTFKGDIIILVAALVIFVACLWLNKWQLNRTTGAVLIIIYVFFVIYQLLAVFAFGWKTI
jgi:Ca2+/Na+ antiporter